MDSKAKLQEKLAVIRRLFSEFDRELAQVGVEALRDIGWFAPPSSSSRPS